MNKADIKKFQQPITLALAGQPNTGKSTLFNLLTGSNQHVGNWPGKTIEQKKGFFINNDIKYKLVDLPGTYSLTANSPEEKISRDFIFNEKPSAVLVMVDSSQLKRTLYLVAEILPLNVPVIIGLNMMDVAEQKGCSIDAGILAGEIGVPVVPMAASKKKGISQLQKTIDEAISKKTSGLINLPEMDLEVKNKADEIKGLLKGHIPASYPKDWVPIKLMEKDTAITKMVSENMEQDQFNKISDLINDHQDKTLLIAKSRYSWIEKITCKALSYNTKNSTKVIQSRFDKIATHPFLGVPVALLIIITALMTAFISAIPLMTAAMQGLPLLSPLVNKVLADSFPVFAAMLSQGLIPGVGMATAFLGFMISMFLVIGFLEDVGYMARMAFVMDKFMSCIGLHGKSFLPIFSSLGCNVAGVLGSRVVDSWQQRMLTLVIAPIVPCIAVWGLVGFVGMLFFGSFVVFLILLLFITLTLWIAFTGLIMKTTFIKDEPEGMIMELPSYHKPNWKTIRNYTWWHTRSFIERGFTLIASASLVIWALSYFPNGNLETSYIAYAGQFLEPIGSIMGLDWRLMIALLASMIAKESALATLGVLYGLPVLMDGSSLTSLFFHKAAIEESVIAAALKSEISSPSALSFIFATFFSIPCLGTIGAIASETRSWKWTFGAASYYLMTTILFGFLAFRLGGLILPV